MTDVPAAGRRDIIVVGASLGGVDAIRDLLACIRPGFAGTMLVVLHRSPYHEGPLARVLAAGTGHDVREAADAERIEPGRVYVAPRDRHLVIENDALRLVRGPKEHFTRPAINPLFRSAAAAFGPRVAGVLLSGGGADGTSGLIAIKAAGGVALVQRPSEARSPWMPRRAIRDDNVDAVLPVDGIANAIVQMMNGTTPAAVGVGARDERS
jgi:two-component system chemotaxis response regulator CheB